MECRVEKRIILTVLSCFNLITVLSLCKKRPVLRECTREVVRDKGARLSQATLKGPRKSKCCFSFPYNSQQKAKPRAGSGFKTVFISLNNSSFLTSRKRLSKWFSWFLLVLEKAQILLLHQPPARASPSAPEKVGALPQTLLRRCIYPPCFREVGPGFHYPSHTRRVQNTDSAGRG